MIAPFTLLHPEPTLRALLGPSSFGPFEQLFVHWQELVVDLIGLLTNGCHSPRFLYFLAGLLHVVHDVTLKAVLDPADGTAKVSLILVLTDKEVVAIFSWAFPYVCVLIANLLPLKLLAPVHLLTC